MQEEIDPNTWERDYSYTNAPMPLFRCFDPALDHDIDAYKFRKARAMAFESGRRNKMLLARRTDGELLYRLSSSGRVTRRFEISDSRRRRVKDRDGNKCVICQSSEWLEVDHIAIYIDG